MAEHPWQESEKVELLVEVLRTAPVTSDYLLSIIRENRLPLKYDEIIPPRGRSPKVCRAFLDRFVHGPLSPYTHPPHPSPSSSVMPSRILPPPTATSLPHPPTSTTTSPPGRVIQPRPIPFVPPDPSASASSPLSNPGTEQSAKRKRGRPTKREAAMRAAEAQSRGEIYPPSKARRLGTGSVHGHVEGAGGGIVITSGPQFRS